MTALLEVTWQQRNPHYAVSYCVFLVLQRKQIIKTNKQKQSFNYMATVAILEYRVIQIAINLRIGVKTAHIETQLCLSTCTVSCVEVSSKVAKRFYLAKARQLIQQLSNVGKYRNQIFKYAIMQEFCPTDFGEKEK